MPKQRRSAIEEARDRRSLAELLNETRILLPGTQVFLGFLTAVPFYPRFAELGAFEHAVYLCAFLGTMLALACFLVPAIYHRIARPIHDKVRFKVMATKLIVLGLVPFTLATIAATFLVCSVVSRGLAEAGAAVVGTVVLTLWWVAPLLRLHDRLRLAPEE